MGATWIAKPVMALSADEIDLWHSIDWGLNLAPSQTPAWGRAGTLLGVEPILVFSPERKTTALFFKKGNEAECVNGPVHDWSCLESATEQNELIGMSVHALLKCRSGISQVTLRPRMAEKDLGLFMEKSAFPADRVERSSTLTIPLETSDETTLFESLGPRVRHEVRRALRADVATEIHAAGKIIEPFWQRCSELYTKKQLWLPPLEWIRTLVDDPYQRASIIRSTHLPTGSLCEVLTVGTGTVGFNLFSSESRNPPYPNLSLNAVAQWTTAKFLRESGFRIYDLNGIAHHDSQEPGFRGVDAYKRKFKGRILEFAHPMLRFG
jgi:hypothetical protein